jgi:hypothetical protein
MEVESKPAVHFVFRYLKAIGDSGLLKRIGDNELRMLLAHLQFANDEGRCWPGPETIAQMLGVSLRTVHRRRAALVGSGLLRIKEKGGGCMPENEGRVRGVKTVWELVIPEAVPNPAIFDTDITVSKMGGEAVPKAGGEAVSNIRDFGTGTTNRNYQGNCHTTHPPLPIASALSLSGGVGGKAGKQRGAGGVGLEGDRWPTVEAVRAESRRILLDPGASDFPGVVIQRLCRFVGMGALADKANNRTDLSAEKFIRTWAGALDDLAAGKITTGDPVSVLPVRLGLVPARRRAGR